MSPTRKIKPPRIDSSMMLSISASLPVSSLTLANTFVFKSSVKATAVVTFATWVPWDWSNNWLYFWATSPKILIRLFSISVSIRLTLNLFKSLNTASKADFLLQYEQ